MRKHWKRPLIRWQDNIVWSTNKGSRASCTAVMWRPASLPPSISSFFYWVAKDGSRTENEEGPEFNWFYQQIQANQVGPHPALPVSDFFHFPRESSSSCYVILGFIDFLLFSLTFLFVTDILLCTLTSETMLPTTILPKDGHFKQTLCCFGALLFAIKYDNERRNTLTDKEK